MARRYQTGFDLGDIAAAGTLSFGGAAGAGATPSLVTSSPVPRGGVGYCLKCGWNNASQNDNGDFSAVRFAHGSVSEVWYAFGLQVSVTGEDATTYGTVFRNFDAAGNCDLVLRFDAGTLRLYRANAAASLPTQAQLTLLGSASASLAVATWALVEVRHLCATGASGAAEVYLNGTQVIAVSSVVTCPANANANEFELCYRRLGGTANAGASNAYAAFDDVRVNDTAGTRNNGRPGDEVVRLLVPDGPGSSAGMSRGGTDSGANWSQAEEVPPSLADYVFHATAGTKDLYAMSAPGALSSCSAVQAVIYAQNSDAGAGSVTITVKTPAGEAATGAATPLSAAATYYRSPILETDPADAGAWTSAKLASLEAGVVVA